MPETKYDKTVEDTFPASDPPANSGITGAEGPDQASHKGDTDAEPTGRPTSDRYKTETADHSESVPGTSDRE